MRILIFGDSITYGAWDTEGGWVERLKRDLHTQVVQSNGIVKRQIFNLGIGGDTSTKILRRMPAEIEARRSAKWPLLLVFTFGANDERFLNGEPEISIEEFTKNTEQIIAIAKHYTDTILFIGSAPLGEQRIDFGGYEYSDERIKEYEQIMRDIVAHADIPFVPIRPIFETARPDTLFSHDGLHPNDKGHRLIAETMQSALAEIIANTNTH